MATTATSTKVRLRQLWFQVHKWIGLVLAVLIIPLCLTGSALVWHDWVDTALNPERSVETAPSRSAGFYADAARRALRSGETLLSLTYPEGAGPVLATAAIEGQRGGGRPVRTLLYLHPSDGHLLDRAGSSEGPVRFMHMLHGSLLIPGVGRQIVGWIGVAMLLSSLTGLGGSNAVANPCVGAAAAGAKAKQSSAGQKIIDGLGTAAEGVGQGAQELGQGAVDATKKAGEDAGKALDDLGKSLFGN